LDPKPTQTALAGVLKVKPPLVVMIESGARPVTPRIEIMLRLIEYAKAGGDLSGRDEEFRKMKYALELFEPWEEFKPRLKKVLK
jgi:hypothetical protein